MSDRANQPNSDAAQQASGPVIIDLGKKRKKQVRALRKGRRGPLLDKVHEAVDSLRQQGMIAPDAQTVIVVVRERARRSLWPT